MLTRILNPYRVFVSEAARAAGFTDQGFPTKKAAQAFVQEVNRVDPSFNPSLRITFRYYDTTTGSLYASRAEYEVEESRRQEWLEHYEAERAKERSSKLMESPYCDNHEAAPFRHRHLPSVEIHNPACPLRSGERDWVRWF